MTEAAGADPPPACAPRVPVAAIAGAAAIDGAAAAAASASEVS